MRGFLLGLIWGSLLGAAVLATASYRGGPGPALALPGTEGTALLPGEEEGAEAARVSRIEDAAPPRDAQASDDPEAPPAPDAPPAPETEVAAQPEAPEPAPDAPQPEVLSDATAPALPAARDAAPAATAPAAPETPAPEAPEAPVQTTEAEAPAPAATDGDDLQPEALTEEERAFAEAIGALPAPEDTTEDPASEAPADTETLPAREPATDTPLVEAPATDAEAPATDAAALELTEEERAFAEALNAVETAEAAPEPAPARAAPEGGLSEEERSFAEAIGVLPGAVGEDGPPPAEDAATEDAAARGAALSAAGPPPALDGRALDLFRGAHDNPNGFPLISVVLLDGGDLADPARALGELPFGLTVILDATRPDATEAMRAYRAEGVETGLAFDLPPGAMPSDVEVLLQGALTLLPEAVVYFTEGRLGEAGRAPLDTAMQILAGRGMGFVTLDRGLSAEMRAAARLDLPAVQVERRLDVADAPTMRRILDRAGFAARQGQTTVIVAEMNWDIISALRSWGRQSDIKQISLAPISALIDPPPAPEPDPEAEAETTDGEETEAPAEGN